MSYAMDNKLIVLHDAIIPTREWTDRWVWGGNLQCIALCLSTIYTAGRFKILDFAQDLEFP